MHYRSLSVLRVFSFFQRLNLDLAFTTLKLLLSPLSI